MNQFGEGLESLGILGYIKKYPDLMRPLFVMEDQQLTVCKLKTSIGLVYSHSICSANNRYDEKPISSIIFIREEQKGKRGSDICTFD